MADGYPTGAIEQIQARYTELFPSYPFFTVSLRDLYDGQFANEKRYSHIFSSLAFMAILLASMGLLSILATTIQRRIRNIAIHKMYGASMRQISWLILKDIVTSVVVGVAIAEGVGTIVIHSWLNNYALRVTLGWWFYFLPLAILFVIIGSLIIRMVLKATLINPGVILKSE